MGTNISKLEVRTADNLMLCNPKRRHGETSQLSIGGDGESSRLRLEQLDALGAKTRRSTATGGAPRQLRDVCMRLGATLTAMRRTGGMKGDQAAALADWGRC